MILKFSQLDSSKDSKLCQEISFLRFFQDCPFVQFLVKKFLESPNDLSKLSIVATVKQKTCRYGYILAKVMSAML